MTHPDITRYFMLVEEAALLVINAGAIGRDGEVLVLDMGDPVKIADVAKRFADQHVPPLEIVFTGLRNGEKLHEDLVSTGESGERPFHPMITHVRSHRDLVARHPRSRTADGPETPGVPPRREPSGPRSDNSGSVTNHGSGQRRLLRVSGSHSSPFSGAAIVHQELVARLAGRLPDYSVSNDFRIGSGLLRRTMGVTGTDKADVCITTSTPLPLRANATRLLPIVYDVRWRWTRGRASRWYRHGDLLRTSRRSGHLLTISHTVAEQLRAMRISPDAGVTVLELGPGQLQGVPVPQVVDRGPSVVLIGSARHKRNELAADLLAQIPGVRSGYRVVAISVSATTKQILNRHFEPSQLEIADSINLPDLIRLLSEARAYLALGYSEGFGLPYIEAAYLGCDVIAPRQSLTLEVLGDDGVLIPALDPTPAQLADALESWDVHRVTRLQKRATDRDWDTTVEQVSRLLD